MGLKFVEFTGEQTFSIKIQLSSVFFCRLKDFGLDFKDLFRMSVSVKYPIEENLRRHPFVDTVLFICGKIQRPASKPIFNCII